MFVVDAQNHVAKLTGALSQRLGHDPEQVVGNPVRTLVAPTDEQRLETALARARDEPGETSVTLLLTTADGDERATVELLAQGDCVVGSLVEDGAAGRETGQSSSGDRGRFGHLFELTRDAVVELEVVGETPVVRAVNPAFVEIFGYEADHVVGESLNEFIVPPERTNQADDFDQRTAKGKVNRAVVERQTADSVRRFLYRGIPYEGRDGGSYGLAIYTDVTDQHRREQQLDVLHRILRHNIRNALTVVTSAGGELAARSDDPEQTALAEKVVRQANSVVEVSRKAKLVQEVVSSERTRQVAVATLLEQVLDNVDSDGRVEFSIDISGTGRLVAPAHLQHALATVVDNAIEHGGENVHLAAEADDKWVHVTVADDGPGIPAHERRPVFEDDDTTQLEHGSSIGLWLAKWTTEAVGGRIGYEREDGWTMVTLTLPRADAEESVTPEGLADD